MFLVGLTGGIATGKSLVSSMIRNMGIEIIDADIIAREVVEPGKKAWKQIRKEFGESVFQADGRLDRPALAQLIFSQPEKRQLLNRITHPEVYKSIFFKCLKLFFSGHQFVVVDLPLLYESKQRGANKYLNMHKTIVVSCEPSQQLERLMARNNYSESEALSRINAQMPLSEKVRRADFVVSNSGAVGSTQRQVEKIVNELRSLRTHWKYRLIAVGSITLVVAAFTVGPYLLYAHLSH